MYIYKINQDDGLYIVKSVFKESLDPNATLLREVSDYADSSLEKFNASIDEINRTHKMKLRNGRFRVDDYLKKLDLTYIMVLHNLTTDRYFIDPVRNVLDKLYRIFVNNRASNNIMHDLDKYGLDDFEVTILGPYHSDELNDRLLDEFNKVVIDNNISNLYRSSKYLQLTHQGRYK